MQFAFILLVALGAIAVSDATRTYTYKFSSDLKNFASAKADCTARGGELALPTSAAEDAKINALVKADSSVNWSKTYFKSYKFYWVNIQEYANNKPTRALSYKHYDRGQPNRASERCVAAAAARAGAWSDRPCANRSPYVCQFMVGQRSQGAVGAGISYFPGVYYYGKYAGRWNNVKSARLCQRKCQSGRRCQFWVYDKTRKRCYGRRTHTRTQRGGWATKYISGTKNAKGTSFSPNVYYYGTNVNRWRNVKSAGLCQRKCQGDKRCEFWVYTKNNKVCYGKSTHTGTSPRSKRYVSGEKYAYGLEQKSVGAGGYSGGYRRKDKSCLNGDGKTYKGKVSVTKSGKTCQRWDANSPQKPSDKARNKNNFPDASLSDAANHCRNPDGGDGPWCYTTDKNKRWEYCAIPMCKDRACLKGDGKTYNGKVSVTKSGKTCQRWDANSPQKPSDKARDINNFPDARLSDAANHCRNPDGGKGPWCYTTDKSKRWEYCTISVCKG